jgi:hypothetical protein
LNKNRRERENRRTRCNLPPFTSQTHPSTTLSFISISPPNGRRQKKIPPPSSDPLPSHSERVQLERERERERKKGEEMKEGTEEEE